MFLVGILSWWYSGGWISRIHMMKDRLMTSADFFSVNLLMSTLFAPFRQISADSEAITISDHIRAFFDKLLSRCIGAIVRGSMIIFGLLALFLQSIFGVVILLFWLIIPLLPAIGLIGMAIGLVPQWIK